ncbi:MAG: cation transporter [Thermoleophilia bacterium]|nr:cation transporter [Thermoleophilia bacterium]
MTAKLAWAALALAPLAVAVRFAVSEPAVVFPIAAAALMPLAWLVSRATEEAGHHTGPAIGGLLNATFGNVPELFVALFAVAAGLHDVVRGSLTGSIVGNLLLVLGLTLLVGGRGECERRPLLESLALVGLAVPLFAVAALPHFLEHDRDGAVAAYTVPVALALLAVYAVVTVLEVRSELAKHERGEPAEWSLRRALIVLAAAMVATALVSETITGSIGDFAETTGLSEFFVSAVVVALAGNAAEHGAAVVAAAHGELELGTDVALESTAQVAAFVVPAVALLSFAIEPLPLAFSVGELAVLAGAVALAALAVAHGHVTRARGAALVAGYLGAVAVFWFV